jgi:predicted transcriptional regulator of viral defense system
MSLKLLVRKLRLENKRFITAKALREYCKALDMDYYTAIRYLTSRGYVVRILRGIFYIRGIEERALGKTDISYADALETALGLKGVKNWYFGLHTALELNNLTHEYSGTVSLLNDTLFRKNPVEVLGHRVRFIKVSKSLFGFGVMNHVSETEKTVLDMIYLHRYNGLSEAEIRERVLDLLPECRKPLLLRYSKHYPKTVRRMVEGLI